MATRRTFSLTPGKRVLFLTKDPALIRKQLAGELDLTMDDVAPEDLLDDINTDAMTPAWVCFDYDPEKIATNAYAGLVVEGERLLGENALRSGDFEVIVAGAQKGVGSSRETAAQAEVYSGSRLAVASSFAPIHARNNINIGQLMADHDTLRRLQAGEEIDFEEFTAGHDPITRLIIEHGGLFPFCQALSLGDLRLPTVDTSVRSMNIAEKILARHLLPGQGAYVQPGDAVLVRVDGGYSHEFTSAQVHFFLQREYGEDYAIKDPAKFAVFEDHLIYADGVEKMRPFSAKIEELRRMQRVFQEHTGVRNFNAVDGVSPGICHQVAREQIIEPGDFIQATDSHTCMGGASGALSWGVGATEYAALIYWGFTPISVPESIRFELTGSLPPGVTAKDVMLHILDTYAKREDTLNRVMEFGGEGLFALSPDERATLANMATECSARGAVMECDDTMLEWIASRREDVSAAALKSKAVAPDPGASYAGGVHVIDLAEIAPMVATPGDPDRGIASDPKNGARISGLDQVAIDIAYGGSCTAGKRDDIDFYAKVMEEAERAGKRVAEGVSFYLQFGSREVAEYARERGYLGLFERTGVEIIEPGCGACIGCGPGVSTQPDQVTVSAINRNYKGRSGPGKLYLASPLTVAASAVVGRIVEYREGMFAE
ncbi:aconitase family protein [Haliangium ochraceum]|uniref:Aconitate hydratase A n=1 Tax=Haliangium ochraceum (strain DSM 14365 / JCM 11303 / SMP-2) TaxID=502025 RepID=D0LGR1_HALO1|nr:aconitase family protein [Haliangium ochraceum]ACY12807.1 aconitate hydratase domain protein [Haliangium ochraceum DSM 14365]